MRKHWPDKTVYIPNKEVSQEYINAISTMEWPEVIDSVENSRKLHQDKPAAIIELKWNKNASGVIAQIKRQQYSEALKDYHGDLLLAGINYDKKTKLHECVIEKFQKY